VRLARVAAVARKEFLHVRRDPRSLVMALAIPALMLLLFGYALTLDVDRVPLAVWDRDGSPESRDLVGRFAASRYFSLSLRAAGYGEIEEAVERGTVLAALVVPEEFQARIRGGKGAPLQLLLDGSDANTATIVLGYAEGVVRGYSRAALLEGIAAGGGALPRDPLELRPRVWFNADLESKNYIVPGLIAVIMMAISALLTSLTVAREWEQGTMEQLVATPVRPGEIVAGKLLPYFVIGMADVLLAVVLGEFLFRVPLRGSLLLLFAMAAIFLAGALAAGMAISIVTRSQLLASQIAMVVTFLPSFLLSGFMYSLGNMPKPVQVMSHLIPARYFVALLKGIYLKGTGLSVLLGEAALLSAFAAAMVLVAARRLKKKLG
jgi:ABC-2 type transport system permease protein